MNSVLALLFRFLVIVFGYAVAALCASAFLHLVTLPLLGFTAEETSFIVMGSVGFSIPFIALFVAYFAFIPAMFGVLLGEVLGQRDWLFYALAGGVIGAVVVGFFRGVSNRSIRSLRKPHLRLPLSGRAYAAGSATG